MKRCEMVYICFRSHQTKGLHKRIENEVQHANLSVMNSTHWNQNEMEYI